MHRIHFEQFRPVCPVCARNGRAAQPLVVAAVREQRGDEILSGILHCPDSACRYEFPILDGIPVIVPDLHRLMNDHGVEILLRDDLDPLLESLVGDAIGPNSWFDGVRQVLSTYGWDGYGDLDPAETAQPDGPVPGAARRCLERLLDLAGPMAPRRIVDLGCASGRTSFLMAERYPPASVLGIDLNLGVLRLARQAAGGFVSYPRRRIGLVYDRRRFPVNLAGSAKVDFWACDAMALPFAAGSADLAVALNLFDCVPEPRRLLAGMADLLASGGRLLMATPYDWSTRATPVETWVGGHSQRAEHGGSGEHFLRTLIESGAHPQSVPGLTRIAEEAAFPWHTRLHERGAVQYRTHLLALGKAVA
jgi:SAM-dependent methyltransferase